MGSMKDRRGGETLREQSSGVEFSSECPAESLSLPSYLSRLQSSYYYRAPASGMLVEQQTPSLTTRPLERGCVSLVLALDWILDLVEVLV
jgi:hypothetical protein